MPEKKTVRIALAGNPNTGKSTVFNALTGLKQHTGNWSGKTVGNAVGTVRLGEKEALLYDTPGVYSLFSDRGEECAAKEFLCFGHPELTVVVLDATALERNLPLGLQIADLTKWVIFCLNLMDEAEKKGIFVDAERLSSETGVPVLPMAARRGRGIPELKEKIRERLESGAETPARKTEFWKGAEAVREYLSETAGDFVPEGLRADFFFGLMAEGAEGFTEKTAKAEGWTVFRETEFLLRTEAVQKLMESEGMTREGFSENRSLAYLERAKALAAIVVKKEREGDAFTEKLDRLFLSKLTGIPIMLLLLSFIFWFTAAGANVPSELLMDGFTALGVWLREGLRGLSVPLWAEGLLLDGVYLTVSWVVSVMLPPMAIFFPLFTLLEDFGLLPRIAFQLDGLFRRAGAHGKQALTMCMGFGCNAAGVTACRIIESPRERLIAILTNSFVPCNGRFPTLILLASFFLAGQDPLKAGGVVFLLVLCSVGVTLLVSRFLGRTVLKGLPSAFVMELPPYRRPKVGEVLVRSLLDRTVFVLGRAVKAALPAGILLWLCQNITFEGMTLLSALTGFLEPFGAVLGLSGAILTAFLLGIPANEIVLPILMMYYSQSGVLAEAEGIAQAGALLAANGWTAVTAVCAILFSLNHFPCATTLLTIRKETGSRFWTAVSFLLPTAVGIVLCMAVNLAARIMGML